MTPTNTTAILILSENSKVLLSSNRRKLIRIRTIALLIHTLILDQRARERRRRRERSGNLFRENDVVLFVGSSATALCGEYYTRETHLRSALCGE